MDQIIDRTFDKSHPSPQRLFSLLLVVIMIGAFSLRLMGIFTDFWFDEIWSLSFTKEMLSPWEIFQIRHDNNHLLNTLFLYFMNEQKYWEIYRIPNLVAGIASVGLMGLISYQRERMMALLATGLMGFSYFFIIYSTEARGYGLVIFFSLLAFYAYEEYQQRKERAALILFSLAIILGFLSHFSFINCYLALLVWAAYRVIKLGWTRETIIDHIKLHLVPFPFFVVLYFTNIRNLGYGGGPIYTVQEVVVETIALTLGGPKGIAATIFVLTIATISFYEIFKLRQSNDDRWCFFLAITFLAPAAILLITRPTYLYPRYFAVPMPFLLILYSSFLTRLFKGKSLAIVTASLLIIFSLVNNGIRISSFLKQGRGHYLAAVSYMNDHTEKGQIITVAGDSDARNRMLTDFYKNYLPDNRILRYINRENRITDPPDWFLIHNIKDEPPITNFTLENGISYELQQSFFYSGISGWNWFLYHRVP